MVNKIEDLLISLNICDKDSIEQFFPRVRDRDDVAVLKCQKSGVIFLSRSDHMKKSHYEDCADLKYWGDGDRNANLENSAIDDQRRSNQFRGIISGKVWLDVGTGLGGILDLMSSSAAKTVAVEPQEGTRAILQKLGYQVYPNIESVPAQSVEVVTLFHVVEHFIEPLKELQRIKNILKPGGKIIIEVPHASDALLASYNNDAFKAFTFWSEHLILHTRQSLTVFLQEAGFHGITVSGIQRYALVNHLYWLSQGKPCGQKRWAHLMAPEVDKAYEDLLNSIDQTDTLIAIAQA